MAQHTPRFQLAGVAECSHSGCNRCASSTAGTRGGQFGFRQFYEVLQSDSVGDIKFSGGSAVQGAQVRAVAELLAKLMRQTSHVGALEQCTGSGGCGVLIEFE